ncbi:MAG: subclass B3 metallo-beta-lactamase [Gemmatimonadota bacterium]|nr:subclass B3 metallo-beta-lactamase [Gemmatimonadota bacterium]MDH3422046.1 subclass B3 metallo-beta-lactamase [Gemmatimonadota bacterium]
MRCLVVILLAALPGAAMAQGSDWTNPREPFQIADDLYYVGTEGLAAFLFTSDQGHLLIDVPLQENVPQVLASIRALGFDPADIRIQLASHAHFDHVGGLADMQQVTGADLVMSAADAAFVRQGRNFGLNGGYPAADVARTVGHLETVRLGDIELTAHLTPGHTPGCTSWGGRVEIEGRPYDFVSICSLSVLGNYQLGGDDPTYAGQARDYCTSVAHLESLEPDIFLAAHGSWFGIDDKMARRSAGDARAFVERGMYRDYLERARASIEGRLEREGFAGGCAGLMGG